MENLIFGHKDLKYQKYDSVPKMLNALSFDPSLFELKLPFVSCTSSLSGNTGKVSARTYLQFAADNLENNGDSEFLNSLTNSKRSVHRRYNEILTDTLSLEISNRAKFEILTTDLGLFIPTLIKDFVVDPRNVFEHEFLLPNQKSAQRAYEVARLFLDSTEKVVGNIIIDHEIGLFKKTLFGAFLEQGLKVSFGKNTTKEGNRFLIKGYNHGATGHYVIVDIDHPKFQELVLLAIKYCQKKEQGSNYQKFILSV